MLRLLESWFADDHALDDRRRLESLAQRHHGTGTPFIRDLGRVWRRRSPQMVPGLRKKLVCHARF